MLKLLAFVLPLAVDSFAVAALLGTAGVSRAQRWHVSALFVGFEAGMPLIGLALGTRLGEYLRGNAERVAALALIGLGLFVLIERLTWH